MTHTTTTGLDIGRVLDDGPFSGLQKTVILLAAMAIVLDGFDGQLIGFAIPLIIKEWGITKAAFAPAVSSFIGAAVITASGASGFLVLLAVGMVGAALALQLVRQHILPIAQRGNASSPLAAH